MSIPKVGLWVLKHGHYESHSVCTDICIRGFKELHRAQQCHEEIGVFCPYLQRALTCEIMRLKSLYYKGRNVWITYETSPKGVSASKCDVGNWKFSKSGIFEKLFGNSVDFFWIFLGFLGEFFGFFLDCFWRIFFEGFFW